MQSLGITKQINAKIFRLLEQNPAGVRWIDLRRELEADGFHPKTVNGCIWKLPQKFPDQVYKPSKGIFRLSKYKEE